MKKVYQTKLHENGINGNCFAACIASILDLSLESIPEFENMMDGDEWWFKFTEWLESINFSPVHWNCEIKLPGYYLVMGTSPRNEKLNHQVIFKNGELYHDPHPSQDGIIDIKETMVLVPHDPSSYIKN